MLKIVIVGKETEIEIDLGKIIRNNIRKSMIYMRSMSILKSNLLKMEKINYENINKYQKCKILLIVLQYMISILGYF